MCVHAWACVCAAERTTSVSMSQVLFTFFCVCILWQCASMVWHPLSSLGWLASDLQWFAYISLRRTGLHEWTTIPGFFLVHVLRITQVLSFKAMLLDPCSSFACFPLYQRVWHRGMEIQPGNQDKLILECPVPNENFCRKPFKWCFSTENSQINPTQVSL